MEGYLLIGNPTEAAKQAGYTVRRACQQGLHIDASAPRSARQPLELVGAAAAVRGRNEDTAASDP